MKDTAAFQITVLYRDFLAYTTDALKKQGLSFGQMPLILYVGKHPDCTQADLTKDLKLDWGYSQRSITKLVESGFMKKELNREKSGNRLNLTETGRDAFDACHQVFESWDESHGDRLIAEEKETLLRLLRKMTAERKLMDNDCIR